MIRLHIPDITEKEKQAVEEVLDSGWITQGEKVAEFEERLARYLNVKEAVCASSCTAAMHMTFAYLKAKTAKKEIITQDFSYPSVGVAIVSAGFEPRFCDIRLDTYGTQGAEYFKNEKTFAIMSTAQFGFPSDYDYLERICDDVVFFEDAAPAIGSRNKGIRVGNRADFTFFSFHATKLLTTGEGGCVATDYEDVAEDLRVLRNHGRKDYMFTRFGFSYRMTDIQAAIGIEQLKSLDSRIQKRRELAKIYYKKFKHTEIKTMPLNSQTRYWNCQRFVVRTPLNNNLVINEMRNLGIECTFGTYSQSAQPIFNEPIPSNTRIAYLHCVALPLHSQLTREAVSYVADSLISIVNKHLTVYKG